MTPDDARRLADLRVEIVRWRAEPGDIATERKTYGITTVAFLLRLLNNAHAELVDWRSDEPTPCRMDATDRCPTILACHQICQRLAHLRPALHVGVLDPTTREADLIVVSQCPRIADHSCEHPLAPKEPTT